MDCIAVGELNLPELEFDIDAHRYTLGGAVLPSCTQVLTAMGATPGFNFLSDDELDFYRSRGHAVHSAVEYSVKGTLDRRTLVEEVRPYLRGWEEAVDVLGIKPLKLNGEPFVEIPLCHPAFRYGVKPDVVAYVEMFKDTGPIEVKATSAHAPATAIQLGAQTIAVRHVMPKIGKLRIGLRLLPKEPFYDFRVYNDPTDEAVWLSLLNSFNWLTRHKLLKENRR